MSSEICIFRLITGRSQVRVLVGPPQERRRESPSDAQLGGFSIGLILAMEYSEIRACTMCNSHQNSHQGEDHRSDNIETPLAAICSRQGAAWFAEWCPGAREDYPAVMAGATGQGTTNPHYLGRSAILDSG